MSHERRDRLDDLSLGDQIATNDAVAGETVFAGEGEGDDGPTGGAPREGEPDWDAYSPTASGSEGSRPFGEKAPGDLRDEDPRLGSEV
ncbi:hypothetical protein VD659_13465 [Herbiconiux sp. 11R-BC]|uniref:hypothetical protein n=1 Tax=Herbiconiux sp. 11R-BC TaxID=3111637 RepID=UPI003C05D06F